MTSPSILSLFRRRALIAALVRRDLAGRYRGAAFGALWAVAEPLVLLAVYTLVFGVLFRLRSEGDSSLLSYSLEIFCGIVPWLMLSETLNRSVTVMLENVSLVKKVIFPGEVLPLKVVLAAAVQQVIGTGVLFFALIVLGRPVHLTWLYLPVLLVPQLLIAAGGAWLAASVGVFLRDLRQIVSLLTLCWLFLTPVFYTEETVARFCPFWLTANPAAALIHNYRNALLRGLPPDAGTYLYTLALGIALSGFGYWWFQKTQRAFVDVL
jgi:lipopolysaccharide transport system permease protein